MKVREVREGINTPKTLLVKALAATVRATVSPTMTELFIRV